MSDPKILYYDLETAPNMSYVWGHYEQNVIEHVQEWYILCISYMWEDEMIPRCVALPDDKKAYKADPENDRVVVQALWDLMNEADIAIAHNGDKFDMRKANSRFLYHRLGPPSPPKQIDTLKAARRWFKFNSNRLGDLGVHLGVGEKEEHDGFSTWAGCMRGDPEAWATMVEYAKGDVTLLRDVYIALRPWMTNHPNLNVYGGINKCPICGSDQLQKRGTRVANTYTYQRYHCGNCGAWPKARLSMREIDKPTIVV